MTWETKSLFTAKRVDRTLTKPGRRMAKKQFMQMFLRTVTSWRKCLNSPMGCVKSRLSWMVKRWSLAMVGREVYETHRRWVTKIVASPPA